MPIQTVIEQHTEQCDDTYHEVFFLEESPDKVISAIELKVDKGYLHKVFRKVYSFEEYIEMQTRPLSDFCPSH